MSRGRGKRKVGRRSGTKQAICKLLVTLALHLTLNVGQPSSHCRTHTGIIADHGPATLSIFAVSKDAKIHPLVGSQRNALNNWG
jgi:hypothetical protein